MTIFCSTGNYCLTDYVAKDANVTSVESENSEILYFI